MKMIILTAYMLDFILGDPENWPHPVRLIGRLINGLDKSLNSTDVKTPAKLIFRGSILMILVIAITAIMVWGVHFILSSFHQFLGYIFYIYLAYTTLAVKNLSQAAMQIYDFLKKDQTESARKALSMIVGRDTTNLNENQISRAVIETVAENFSDGVMAPLFYLFLGGPLLAIVYKAINTMDSMIGYKNQQYLYFGRCAAKLDDLANWIPARVSVVFFNGCRHDQRIEQQKTPGE